MDPDGTIKDIGALYYDLSEELLFGDTEGALVYPNPFISKVEVIATGYRIIEQYRLYDQRGRLIQESDTPLIRLGLDIKEKGMLFLLLVLEDGSLIHKKILSL